MIVDLEISDPVSGSKIDRYQAIQFNVFNKMGQAQNLRQRYFETRDGARNLCNFFECSKPQEKKFLGIAQIGKAFRNEIIARQFIFRMREFEQMEMQFFVKPGTQSDWYKIWKEKRLKWQSSWFGEDNYRFHDHDKLAHYADAACDIEFNFPFGFKELEGIHSRTDFDLTQHEEHSGKN